MKNYLNFVRWPNILIIFISMFLILYCLVNPLLGIESFSHGLSVFEFSLLVISTIFIAVGGNILNDINDVNPDSVNKAGKNLVGKSISFATAWNIYYLITILGLVAGSFLSYRLGKINYSLIFLMSAGLLWFYSKKYQHQVLIGNIVVAILSSISFGIVWLFQFFALSEDALIFTSSQNNFHLTNRIVLIYMGFAFICSLVREIIKDAEDFKGDDRFGSRTLAVVYGVDVSAKLATYLSIVALLSMFWVQYLFYSMNFMFIFYYFFLIDLMFVFLIYKLKNAKEKKQFSKLSLLSKIIMASGIISIISFYFN